jgi:acyl-CoA synthetase (AMP-forming)/AMP-acid ligase II
MNLAEIPQIHARQLPGVPAIVEAGRRGRERITFSELDEAAAHAAGLLGSAGLSRGDVVLVFQPISIELYVALAAIFRLGLVAMFVDPSAGRKHLDRCCEIRPPRALIASPRAHLLRLLSPRLAAVPIKFVIGTRVPGAISWNRASRARPHRAIEPVAPDHPALLTFTSGSTGLPKAVLRTHGFLLEQHRVLQECLRLKAGQIDLATMPVVLLSNLAAGVTSLIPDIDLRRPGAINPARLVRQMQQYSVDSAVASPALFERLTRYCARRDLKFQGLRQLATGGAPVFPRLLAQMQTMAPQANVLAVYGSTEAEPIARLAFQQIDSSDQAAMIAGRGLLAGRPVANIQLRILGDQWGRPIGPFDGAEFTANCLPPEQTGEIVVSGSHVLSNHLTGDDEQTGFQVDGTAWHRTGDAGFLDSQGRLWLLGRCTARIEDRHGVVYPFSAEVPLYCDPHVRRAAIASRRGRRILLVEYFGPRHRAAPLDAALLRDRLHVDELRVCRHIPVDARHNAKIDYPRLYQLLDRQRQ